MFKQPDKKYI